MHAPQLKYTYFVCKLPSFLPYNLHRGSRWYSYTCEIKPAVPLEMLKKVHNLLKSGISIEDVVDRLRTKTVPKGYPCHPWLSGVYVMYYAQHVYVVWWYMYIVCVCLCVCMCVHLHAYMCLLVVA